MGSSEIEGTAGISHPLPPFSTIALNEAHNGAGNHEPTLSLRYVNRSYWNSIRIAWKAMLSRLSYHLWITRYMETAACKVFLSDREQAFN